MAEPKDPEALALMRSMRADGATYEEIGRAFNVSAPAVHKRLNPKPHNNLRGSGAAVDASKVKALNQEGKNNREIARELGCSESAVLVHLSKLGLKSKRKRLPVNAHAFDDLSINEPAQYVLGLILTDGHINSSQLKISMTDKEAVEAVRDLLAPGKQLVKRLFSRKNKAHADQWGLIVRCAELRAPMEALGVFHDKVSTCVAPPGLELSSHFWRGVVDGDGCVAIGRHAKYGRVDLATSSPQLKAQYADFVRSVAGANASEYKVNKAGKITKRGRPCQDTWHIIVQGHAAAAVCNALYTCGGVAIARKRSAALEIIQVNHMRRKK